MTEELKKWIPYLVKAVIAFAVILLVVHALPSLPPLAVGICWALLSAVIAVGIAYPYIVRKLLNRHEFEPGGRLSKINDGRIVRLVISFVVAAVLVGGLVLEAAKWTAAQWAVAALAIPLFMASSMLLRKFVKKEFRDEFRTARNMQFSRVVVAVLLCVVYLAVLSQAPVESYRTAAEAFLAAQNPFGSSPSVLLSEGGKYVALVDGLNAFMISKAAESSFSIYVIWKVLLGISAFYSIAAVMGLCSLEPREIRRVFTTIEQGDGEESSESARDQLLAAGEQGGREESSESVPGQLVKRFVAVLVVLPVCLVAGFMLAEGKAAEVVETQEYTAVEQAIRNQAGLVVCVIDGKTYDYEAVKDFLARLDGDALSLSEEAAAELTGLINEAFDKRVENVDKYLDWYYSLSTDYECLMHLVNNNVEDFMCNELESHISEGIDDSKLNERIEYYAKQAEALENAAKTELAAYEVDVPEWLIQTTETIDMETFEAPFDATERLQKAGTRLAAGGITALAINHLIGKRVIKKMVEKLATKLGVSATEKIASVAFVSAGPVGVVVKIGVDVVTTVVLDYVYLKADEAMNRETYKQEIIDGINEQRNEMLALVEQ